MMGATHNPNGDRRLTIGQVRALHPMPWAYGTTGQALVIVMDAVGNEVPLFTLLDFICNVTVSIDAQDKAEAAQKASNASA